MTTTALLQPAPNLQVNCDSFTYTFLSDREKKKGPTFRNAKSDFYAQKLFTRRALSKVGHACCIACRLSRIWNLQPTVSTTSCLRKPCGQCCWPPAGSPTWGPCASIPPSPACWVLTRTGSLVGHIHPVACCHVGNASIVLMLQLYLTLLQKFLSCMWHPQP